MAVVSLDYHDPEWLRETYQRLGSDLAVAKVAGVSESAIANWRRKLGIPIANEAYRERGEKRSTVGGSLADSLRKYLKRSKRRHSIEDLCDHFGVCPRDMKQAVAVLENAAVLVNVVGETVALDEAAQKEHAPFRIDFTKYAEVEYPIGVLTDTHVGSKYERLDVAESLFDRFAAYGVQTVYHAGNIIDGEKKGINEFDIYVHGFEDQVVNLIEKWPRRPGIVTHFITGDDHEGWYTKRENINTGKAIEREAYEAGRDDLRHLGYQERDIWYEQPYGKARIRIAHPGGGSAYATSYKGQKYVESLQGGDKPQIFIAGHYHKFNFDHPREVYVLQPGCTEDQTPFMRKLNLRADVGGCVLWVKQNELGIFTSVKCEWMPYFDRTFYERHW